MAVRDSGDLAQRLRTYGAALATAVAIALLLAPTARADHVFDALVSTGPAGGNGLFTPVFVGASADGSVVFFETSESLVAADTDSSQDVYARSGGVTTLVSIGPAGGNGAFPAVFGGASADGSHVFFSTQETLVAGDTDSASDVYERSGGVTTLVSSGPAGGNGAFAAVFRAASTDGSRVFFETSESLVAGAASA